MPTAPLNFVVPPEPGKTRFQDLDIAPEIMHSIAELDFRYCTTVQAQALPHSLKGSDVSGKAQTGTGKTAAFLITILQQFHRHPKQVHRPGVPRALVLAPTRELALQIVKDAHSLGKYCNVRTLAIYGGMDYRRQQEQLHEAPVDIIAATPGRLLDFMMKKLVDLSQVEVLIIDEADRMLDMGFIPDVRRIIRKMPPREKRQSMLFSATLTPDILRLASEWMRTPVVVEIEPEMVVTDTIEEIVYSVPSREKFTLLYNLLKQPALKKVLIFGNRRDTTETLFQRLQKHNFPCELMTGAVDQKKRLHSLEDFRSGKLQALVATDVAGRGLHVEGVTHVINYEFPYEAEDYVHRVGRTGRAGHAGVAISFACEDESFVIPDIEKYIGRELRYAQPEEHLLKTVPLATAQHSPRRQ